MAEPTLLHHFLDRAAGAFPDRSALTCGGATHTYRELDAASHRLTGWLRGRGLGRGDRLLIAAAPDSSVVALCYAASRLGVVFSVVHEDVKSANLRHVGADCQPRLIVSDNPDWTRVPDATLVCPASLAAATGDDGAGAAAGSGAADPLAIDPVCLVYTSGSTAMPKAVVSTHQQAVFVTRAIASQLRYHADDIVYVALPLSFDYGLYQLFLAAAAGAHVWLGGTAGPGLVGELSRARATVLPAVPTLATTLARLLDRHHGEVPPLRLLTNTGAAMPAATLARLRAAVPGLGVQLMFGLTECKRVSIMPVDGDLHHPGSGGRPLPGTDVRVVDDHGAPVPNGTTGELVVRGPHVMSGYWRRPEQTAQRFVRRDGLFPELHTGDYGWLDDDGYLYFAGRRDDLYKSRGFRVSTVEVEAAACRVDGVRAAAVLTPGPGRADAILVVATALGPLDVLAGLRRELEDFKVPPTCVCLDALPTNGNGKIDKQALAAALDREPVDVG